MLFALLLFNTEWHPTRNRTLLRIEVKSLTPCTALASIWLLLLSSTFTRNKLIQKWVNVFISGRELFRPHFPELIVSKSVSEPLWTKNYSPSANLFHISGNYMQAPRCSIATSLVSARKNYIPRPRQVKPLQQRHAMQLTYKPLIFPLYSTLTASFGEQLVSGTDSQKGISPITTIIIFSMLG